MKKKISVVLALVAVILAVGGWFILPSTVGVQIGLNGQVSRTFPKIIAVLFPVVLAGIGCASGIRENDDYKSLFLPAVAIAVEIFMFVVNR